MSVAPDGSTAPQAGPPAGRPAKPVPPAGPVPSAGGGPPAVDFPMEFADPADAELSWEWDDMHMPFALTPLAADYVETIAAGINAHYVLLDFPQRMKCTVWNGYAYFALQPNSTDEERAARREEYFEICRRRAEQTTAYWTGEALPELNELYGRILAVPVEDLSTDALADAWVSVWADAARAWEIHFIAILGPYQILEDLADLYEKAVPGAGSAEALRLVQGGSQELFEVELQAEQLAVEAARLPAIAARLRAGGPIALEELATLPDGPAFVAEVDRYLGRHGHLGQGFDDLSLASWAEEPGVFLTELAKRVEHPAMPAEARRARLSAEADSLADVLRTRLADRPEDLARFEHLLALARQIGPLTEGHNYWIDRMAQARMRTFAMRVGRRLVREGVLASPSDIFFLHAGEVADLLRAPADHRRLVADRHAEHARQRAVRPPKSLGRPRPAGPADRFFGERIVATEADMLRGTGASAGVVRGPARIALSPDDFGRIQPGDIIVCPSSNPSWVPVFAIAAGLVTNTGGVLSHAAVVAREFGLPAVVGTGDATDRIADDRQIEIDGTLGTVRLL